MKSKIIIVAILCLSFFACGKKEADKTKFITVYKEILLTREMEKDSLKANEKVNEILKNNGYNMASFKVEFMKLAKNYDEFNKTIDSVRGVAQKEASFIKDTNDPFYKK